MKSANVLLAIILILVLMLIVNIIYGCKFPTMKESFEDKVMTEEGEASNKPTMDKPINNEKTEGDDPSKELPTVVTKESDKIAPVSSSSKEEINKTMTQKEKELFKSIVQEKFSTQDLEKLVKAGVLTENTIEKFLNEMEEAKQPLQGADTVEGFSCQRDYATF